MRHTYKIASSVLVLATAVACGGAGEDEGLFGASGGSAGSGGGSAGKSSGGTSSAGTGGKASGGSGGNTTGGSGGKAAGGNTTGGNGGAPVAGASGMSGNAGQPGAGKGGAGGVAGGKGGAGGVAGKGGAGGVAGKGGAGGSKGGAAGNTGGTTSGGSGGTTSGGNGGTTSGGAGGDPTGGAGGNTTGGAGGDPTGGAGGNTTGGAGGDPTGGAGGNTTGGAGGDPTGGAGGAGTGGTSTGGAGTGGAGAGGAGTGGTGGAPGCVGDHTACATTSGNNGLCVNGSCSDCVAPADDAACRTAYPTSDLCVAGSCEACDAPGTTLFVDPVNGSDARGLGSVTANGSAAPTCALKTITAAIKLINSGTVANTISVVGPATLDVSESYPLVIPANVVVTTKGDVVAAPVPANAPGNNATMVRLVADGAAIDTDDTFTIDGSALAGNSQDSGITADNGSTDATHLRGVTITNMPGNGIRLQAKGRLTINEGVTVTGSGRAANFSGIFLTDGGSFLTIDVPSGRPTVVEKSGASGITLSGLSGLKLSGVPGGAPGTGTVVIRQNAVNGMSLQANGASQLGVSVDGAVTYNNGTPGGQFGDGMYILMNTKATIRRSVSLFNRRSGIHVDGGNAGVSLAGNQVDLGSSGDDGANWVQNLAADGDQNGGVGICFTPPQTYAAGTLPARGNFFGKGKDCAITAAMLTKDGQCSGQKDTTVASISVAVTMDVTMCTIP